ncbi:MAG: hypothetical protein LBG24_04150 [Treponema sp.]|nr:hypothetical protein [Treponema sp.]
MAERPLKQFLGQVAEHLDVDAVYAVLMDIGILEPLKVEIQDAQEGKLNESGASSGKSF